jgi:hypothetical protein
LQLNLELFDLQQGCRQLRLEEANLGLLRLVRVTLARQFGNHRIALRQLLPQSGNLSLRRQSIIMHTSRLTDSPKGYKANILYHASGNHFRSRRPGCVPPINRLEQHRQLTHGQ